MNKWVVEYGAGLWQIARLKLSPDGKITSRSKEPLVRPPAGKPDDPDIAFTALAAGDLALLFSCRQDKLQGNFLRLSLDLGSSFWG